VDDWQTELSGLVASEEYTQHLRVRFGGSQTLRLKSDVLLVRVKLQQGLQLFKLSRGGFTGQLAGK